MDPQFWLERWEKKEIGFHQAEINPHLRHFWNRTGIHRSSAVFVPLCGKSMDLVWLHDEGHTIWGVELSALAVEEFFAERGLQPRRAITRGLPLYRAERYNIYCADFFKLRPVHLPQVDAVYDRASLVALPMTLRQRYANRFAKLVAPGTRTLLVSVDYPPTQMQGPPFAVDDAEVNALFGPKFEVNCLLATNVLDHNPRFRERGLTRLEERVYCLTRK